LSRDCLVCRKHRGELPPPGGALFESDQVFASHAFDLEGGGSSSYLGHLIVEPKRHIAGLAGLSPEEARLIGELTATLARAPEEYRFTRVDEAPNAPKGGPIEIAAVTERIRAQLPF
jgi:histidine triad (HIT) family protein